MIPRHIMITGAEPSVEELEPYSVFKARLTLIMKVSKRELQDITEARGVACWKEFWGAHKRWRNGMYSVGTFEEFKTEWCKRTGRWF